ncbi:MAG: glycosyltransferase family 4 protein [Acidobacteria bacterium]|nr:glycosyltransferase family 4 protein [Acidobacteriota bacterium]
MPRVLINALASTAGGGITYLRNVLPRLEKLDRQNRYIALVPPEQLGDYARFESERVIIATVSSLGGAAGRLLLEQTWLRAFVRWRKIDVLVSLGNFALLGTPIPQILFNRNEIYFSHEFARDLRSRKHHFTLASHRLKSLMARASIKQAQINVTPTTALADRIHAFDGLSEYKFEVLHFGFDPAIFTADNEPLPAKQMAKLRPRENCRRLLYVSHYNYYRNFETLIRALPAIKREIREREDKKVLLVLTTDIKRGAIYGGYDATVAAELIDELGVGEDVAMLGAVDYTKLHQLYRVCDLFVCPSYSESFGHPLVEAMASGTPVVSANQEVHREICGDAAIYFDLFDETDLARKCVVTLLNQDLRAMLKERGLERVKLFSWDEHVLKLVKMIERCSVISPYRED